MMNSNLGDLDATRDYFEYNNASDSYENAEETDLTVLEQNVWLGIILITCCIGLVGNGYIIWLLGFQIKRNCFTTFIFNLAIADLGYLASVFIHDIGSFINLPGNDVLYLFYLYFIRMMFSNANFLLAAISIDRCVAILFPIWHHCSRPKHLSSAVCAFLWISSFLLSGIISVMEIIANHEMDVLYFLLIAIICLPLITISTVVLFIKVCFKPKQKNKSRLLLMILITLFAFLILAFPLCIFGIIIRFSSTNFDYQLEHWFNCSALFSCLNSSINPVVYFLLGRKKGAPSKESMKAILQKVFKESEATGGR